MFSLPSRSLSHHVLSPITFSLPSRSLSHHVLSPITFSLPSRYLSHHVLPPITLSLPSRSLSHPLSTHTSHSLDSHYPLPSALYKCFGPRHSVSISGCRPRHAQATSSSLRRVKNYLRSTMTQTRLSDLALLYIE